MKDFLKAAKLLGRDLASTLLFLVIFLLTNNIILAVGLGTALGLAQIALQLTRKKPIEILEWLSLALIIATGAVAILTDDPRVVLFKPSVLYAIVGCFMLRPGWMNRYLPPIVRTVAPDVGVIVGFVWAALMFASAALNTFVALTWSVATWAAVMPAFGIASKVVVFLSGFAAIRLITARRVRALPAAEQAVLRSGIGPQAPSPAAST
jgi:intracellular septation protein A